MRTLAIMLCLVCVSAGASTLPPMPRLSAVIRSPKDAANQPTVQAISPVQPFNVQVVIAPMTATVAYDLQPVDGFTQLNLETGIVSSPDLVTWTEAWSGPYPTSTHVQVTLSNQPPVACFYRAFWRFK